MPTDLPYSRYTRQSRFTRGARGQTRDVVPEPKTSAEPAPEITDAIAAEAARRARPDAHNTSVSPLIYAFFAAAILPVELTVQVGALNMTPFKLIMLVVAIPALIQFFSRCRFTGLDALFFAYAIYTMVCTLIKTGVSAIDGIGLFGMETIVVYAIVRVAIRSVDNFRAAIQFLIGIMVILGLLAIPEAVMFNRFLHDIPAILTGIQYPQQNDIRFGMLRASSTFSHQILFGIAVSSLVIYAWIFSESVFRRVRTLIGLTVGAFFSLSSSAWLLFVIQLGFIAAERMTRMVPKRGMIILLGISAVYIFLELASNRGPVMLITQYLTLNSQSSYFRILIWEYAIDDVWRSPLIGIIPTDWTRPAWMPVSIDNHWLVLALRGGIPSFLFIAIFIIITLYRIANMPYPGQPPAVKETGPRNGQRSGGRGTEEWDPKRPTLDIRNGWIISILSLVLGGATVAYYGKMFPIFTFYLALGPALLAMVDPVEQTKYQRATGGSAREVPKAEDDDTLEPKRGNRRSGGRDRRR